MGGPVRVKDGAETAYEAPELIAQGSDSYGNAHIDPRGAHKFAQLKGDDIAAATRYVVIDLSDTTNFPHTETGRIRLYSIILITETKTDGSFDLNLGVVIENDGTDGSTNWFLSIPIETVINPTDSTDRRSYRFIWPTGFDLQVDSGAMVNLLTQLGETDEAAWINSANLASPNGTSNPGAGDLVALLDETGGAGTISFTLLAEYTTEKV